MHHRRRRDPKRSVERIGSRCDFHGPSARGASSLWDGGTRAVHRERLSVPGLRCVQGPEATTAPTPNCRDRKEAQMVRIARYGTADRQRRSTLRSTLLVIIAALTTTLVSATSVAAGQPEVSHERFGFTHEVTTPTSAATWGVFRFSGTDTFTVVDFSDGVFHFNLIERGTYTLTFLDEPQETWNSRFIEAVSFNATPGGTFVIAMPSTASRAPSGSMRRGRSSSDRTDRFASTTPPSSWTSARPRSRHSGT